MPTFKANAISSRPTMLPLGGNVLVGSALTFSTIGTPPGGFTQNPSPANGDSRTASFWAAAGVYTLAIYYNKLSSGGIFDYYVDDTSVVTGVDTYNAATTVSNKQTATVTLGYSGMHKTKLTVNGKNASSSNYQIQTGLIWLYPAIDSVIASGTSVNISDTDLPRREFRTHDEATITTGNALAFTADTSQFLNGYWMQSASANADVFTQSVWLAAGPYYLVAIGQTDNGSAIIDWSLDGSAVATGQDWYSAALTRNVVKTSNVFVLSTAGYHILKGTINSRNGSNVTAYNVKLSAYGFRQAGD